jgi:Uma2 family endonuclease
MATATELSPPATLSGRPFDISADMFSSMVERGVFPPDSRVFLWNGRLYEKIAKTVPHAVASHRIHEAVWRRLPPEWITWSENPIVLSPDSVPLPDLCVVRGPIDLYIQQARHPGPQDVGLVVEIAVTSLPKDLGDHREVLARASIPTYWVADVKARRLLAHSEPRVEQGRGLYARIETYQSGQSIPLILDGQTIASIPFDEILRG